MSVHLVLIDALNLIRRIYAVQERPFLMNNELSDNTKKQVLFNTQQACINAVKKIIEQQYRYTLKIENITNIEEM